MPAYTDLFGGTALQPAEVAYRAVALSASVALVWPPYATTATDYVAGIMDVTPSGAGFAITMPEATLASTGTVVIYRNLGTDSYTVDDSTGSTIATVAAGEVRYIYLQDNSTAAGTWASILFGVGSSTPDASQLVGLGLKVIGNTLNQSALVTTFTTNYTVLTGDRGTVFIWTGGSGTLTLPSLASSLVVSDFFIEVRNEGTGVLTVAPVGGSEIDSAASIDYQVGDSSFVHAGASAWYTVGRGRNTQFNFTQLTKTVTGGTTTLSLTEAANVVQQYSGTLSSDEIVVVPAAVQVYYMINGTSGAHTFTVKTPITGGSTVAIQSGTTAILFCDGTNIFNCTTSGVVAPTTTLPVGSAGSPSLNFQGDTTTGVFQPTSGTFAISISGTEALRVTSTGLNNTAIGQSTPAAGAFTTLSASTGMNSTPIGQSVAAAGAFTTLTSNGVQAVTVVAGTVSQANFTTTSVTLTAVTNLLVALAANATYLVTIPLSLRSTTSAGIKVGINFSASGAIVEAGVTGYGAAGVVSSSRISAFNTANATAVCAVANTDTAATITGIVSTGANAGNLTVQVEKVTSGTATVYGGSALVAQRIA